MENHFRISHYKLKTDFTTKVNKRINPPRNQNLHQQRAATSFHRAVDWSKHTLTNEETMHTLRDGTIPLDHPDTFEYRKRDRTKENPHGNIYVRNHQSSAHRAETARQDFVSTHLELEAYNDGKYFLEKTRVIDKEMGPALRFGKRTENERLFDTLNGPIRLIDPAAKDNKMLTNPSWKDISKNKWISPKDFDLTTCYFRGKKSDNPWTVIPIRTEAEELPYTDGFETTGDLSRKRNKALEISPVNFLTTVSPNHARAVFNPPMNSTSIRSIKSANFIASVGPEGRKTYPKTLRHIMNNLEGADQVEDSKPPTPPVKTKLIQIRSGTLDPLKESMLSTGYRHGKSDACPMTGRGSTRSFFSDKRKKEVNPNRNEYIKQTVRAYFG